jgi:hypothetical protein
VAAQHLRSLVADDPLARTASLGTPIPVTSPVTDQLDSWFVPLVDDQRLIAFIQLEPDLRFHRYASFQRVRGSLESCPPAAAWLDLDTILARAEEIRAPTEKIGQPVLSYDGTRDRIAWRIPITNGRSSIYVAGESAFRRPA